MSRAPLAFSLLLSACAREKDAGALPTCSVEAPADTPLRAEGDRLYDGHGRRVWLRGVNAGGRSKFAPYLPFDAGDDFDGALERYLDRAASWGLTTLRVPFTWAALEPTEGAWDEDWLLRYEALLDGAAARGLWTIVDFHQDLYAEPLCGDGFPAWTLVDPGPPRHDCATWFLGYFSDSEVKAAFDDLWSDARGARTGLAAMWAFMAARQADRPGVIGFEILNEPFAGSADPAVWGPETLTPFYTALAAQIHADAPDALVFFDATGLDATKATTALARPEGEGLVFAPHYYDAAVFLGGEADPDQVDASLGRWQAQGEDWQVPVLLGEIGVAASNPGAEDYAAALWDSLDARQLHATWWEYSDSAELWNEEDFSLIGPDGLEREALLDLLARPTPRALAEQDADATRWSWDAAARRFVLDFDALADGISEITLPTRIFSGAPTLRGEGLCADPRADRVTLRADGGPAHLEISL